MSESQYSSDQGSYAQTSAPSLSWNSPIPGNATPAYVLAGVMILTMIALGVVMAMKMGSPSSQKTEVAQAPAAKVDISTSASNSAADVPTSTTLPAPVPTPTPPKPATKPATARAKIDLLSKVDLSRDVVAGQWLQVTGGISSDESKFARISIPYEPPKEYDFRIEFTRVLGNDSVLQIFRDNGKECTWVMNGWKGTASAFNTVGGKQGPDNGAGVKGLELKSGSRHISIVKVRKDFIEASLDGKVVVHYDTDGSDLGRGRDWNLGRPRTLGVGSNQTATIFHKIELTEISGKGKSATTPISLPPPAPPKEK